MRNTSPYYEMFRVWFDGADAVSAVWQPLLKSVGRAQLEMASLTAKQGHAALQWTRSVATSPTPAGIVAANTLYLQAVSGAWSDSARKLTSAASNVAAATPDPFELVMFPPRRTHDTIVLPQNGSESEPARRVA